MTIFVHVKGLRLDEIATELSNTYGQDAYAPFEHEIVTTSNQIGENRSPNTIC
jgi:hypothetical protein